MKAARPDFIRTADGTRLAVYDLGQRDAPVLFLINGLGGNLDAWKHIVSHYRKSLRIVSFDYRGLYNSGKPPSGDFRIEAHTLDAVTVLNHFGIDEAVVMGWSMGVQVVLDFYKTAPERCTGLILANGASGRPLDKAFPLLKGPALAAMKLLAVGQGPIRLLMKPFTTNTLLVKAAKKAGFVSRDLDESIFLDLAVQFSQLDFDSYDQIVLHMVEHDATDVLRKIEVPVLVVAGDIDFFAPMASTLEMVRAIPDARMVLIKGGSHYCAVEYPEQIIEHMDQFLEDRIGIVKRSAGRSRK